MLQVNDRLSHMFTDSELKLCLCLRWKAPLSGRRQQVNANNIHIH